MSRNPKLGRNHGPVPQGPRREAKPPTISVEDAVAALRRSGYLLETRIAAQLDAFAYDCKLNVAFTDPETGQSRELDAYAVTLEMGEEHEFFSASTHILVECINNPQPIAFFMATRGPEAYPITATRPSWLGPNRIEDSIKISDFHHTFKGHAATNYCTFVQKKSGQWMVTHADEQHHEFTTLATVAQLAREKQRTAQEDLSQPQDAIEICEIHYICPVLVVEGSLFAVGHSVSNDITLEAVDQIRFVKCHIWKGARRYCPIDVVTEKAFPSLLRQIELECRRTVARLEQRADEIMSAVRTSDGLRDPLDSLEDMLP